MERDFSVPSDPNPVRVAVDTNTEPRWRSQIFHQLLVSANGNIAAIVPVGIDLAKNVLFV